MKLAFDLSVLRHPSAGTARYAVELFRAMCASAEGDSVMETHGWPRGVAGGGIIRRVGNLTSDIGWLTAGATAVALRHRVDAWFGPANAIPLAMRLPRFVTIHDANFIAARNEYDPAFTAYATRMYRLAGQQAAAVLTHSEFSRLHLISDLGIPAERILIAPPGIDHSLRVKPAPRDQSQSAPYALFVGQTEPHKNLIRLVDAWPAVPHDLELVLAGPAGRGEVLLMERIASSPSRGRIRRLGNVDEAYLARLYSDATCFVFPSLAEGFGMPPLEAMVRGIPTAVADAGALPETTQEGALLFDPTDSDAIADAVTRVVGDNRLRLRLAEKGPIVAGRYLWRHTAGTAWGAIRGRE